MILNENDKQSVKQYNFFVRNNRRGQVSQDTLWGKLKKNWGHLYIYRKNSRGDIIAAMGILTIEAVPGKILAYCPKGPIADFYNIDLIKSLINEAISNLPKNTFLIRMDPEVDFDKKLNQNYLKAGFKTRNLQVKKMHGNIQPRLNIVMSYKGIQDKNQLMRHFKRTYRTEIRHSIRDGVKVKFGTNQKYVNSFYKVYKKMADSHHITYRPISYFYRMSDLFTKTGLFRIYLAYYQENVIAAGIGFSYGDEIWYMYAGSDRDYSKHLAPYLIQWEMTKWGLAEKKSEYDFGGVGSFDMSDGLYRFKHGFAYRDKPKTYIGEIDKVLDKKAYKKYLKNFE